jgi:hypothetical protein
VSERLTLARVVPWLSRALWLALPFTAGPALADALHDTSRPVQVVASIGLWLGWVAGLVATVVPHPVTLTVVRMLAPAAAAAAAATGRPLAVAWTAVTAVWVFAPPIGVWCVNGPAYPNERRLPLRAPGALLAGPLLLAWALVVAGIAAGPLLLAARSWVAGALATVVGLPIAIVLGRALHGLSRRWLVFVPAGLVVHDPISLLDPVLFRRQDIERLGPAPIGTDALDLTQRSPGLALEVVFVEPAELTLLKPGHRVGDRVNATALLVTPTRPGDVLAEARARRIRTA